MEGIKVSVIVPVYNVEEYVAECIESILNQSLKEIEIIIVDDCSTDNSYHICRKYETDNPDKIRLFRHEKNLGLPSARNTGLKHAKGDYIGFVDSDDFIGPDRFKDLFETAMNHDSDIVFCWTLPPEELKEGIYLDPYYSNEIMGKFLVYLSDDGFLKNYSVNVYRRLIKRELLEINHITFLEELFGQ